LQYVNGNTLLCADCVHLRTKSKNMCCNRIIVHFPSLQETDNDLTVQGMTCPAAWNVNSLVAANPSFFYEFGVQGAKTLALEIFDKEVNFEIISGTSSPTPVTHRAEFVRSRPPIAR